MILMERSKYELVMEYARAACRSSATPRRTP